jgi:hypothetical protein
MAPIVVPDAMRISYVHSWTNGREVVNTIDCAFDESGTGMSRAEVAEVVAEDFRNAWQDHIIGPLTDNLALVRVDYIDLNSLDGAIGSLAPDPGRPTQGTTSAGSMPPNVNFIVTKVTGSKRGVRSGRFFIAGVPEGDVNEDGVVSPATRAVYAGYWGSYFESVTDLGTLEVDKRPIVIHSASATGNAVTEFRMEPLIGRQDRRIGR